MGKPVTGGGPVASARANPRIAYVNSWPEAFGFRAVPEIRAANTVPIPTPALVVIRVAAYD